MDAPGEDRQEDSIGDLFGRLADDGRAYARAELELYAAIARYRGIRARRALVALAAGWFFLVTAMMALVLGGFLSLAARIGPMWAGVAIGIPLALAGYFLVHYGWTGIKGLGRDQGERAAIERAGRAP